MHLALIPLLSFAANIGVPRVRYLAAPSSPIPQMISGCDSDFSPHPPSLVSLSFLFPVPVPEAPSGVRRAELRTRPHGPPSFGSQLSFVTHLPREMRFVRPSYRIVYRFSPRASPVTPSPILGGERSDRESSVPLSGDRTCGCVWSATD